MRRSRRTVVEKLAVQRYAVEGSAGRREGVLLSRLGVELADESRLKVHLKTLVLNEYRFCRSEKFHDFYPFLN